MNEHLHNIDEQLYEQIGLLTAQMAARMSATEKLMAYDLMCWAQMMNKIKANAEEIVLKEVIYK